MSVLDESDMVITADNPATETLWYAVVDRRRRVENLLSGIAGRSRQNEEDTREVDQCRQTIESYLAAIKLIIESG